MRSKSLIVAIAISILGFGGLAANAQERPTWGPAVGFANGTFIQTGIGTVPAGELEVEVLNTEVATSASTPSRGVFRRILRLHDGRAIIYEIAVSRRGDRKEFEVTLGSWMPTSAEAREMEIDPARVEANFLGKYTAPITVNDGDLLAVDVLQNPRTGVKLVDYFRISGRRPLMGDDNSPKVAVTARPIGIENIEFMIENFDLRLNGKEIYASKGGIGGRYFWLDIPQTGRFIFSLTPLSEADGFHRDAYLARQQIVFNHGDDTYILTSERPIVTASGTFNLWMRRDPGFSFPTRWPDQAGTYFSIGAADSLPLQTRRE